jgi:hypothetical protein
MKRLTQTLPLLLAATLQLMPLLRNIVTSPAASSSFAFILRWGIGAGAALESVDAVSGATSVFTSPSAFSGTVGNYFSNNVVCSIGGGNSAARNDYLYLQSGTVTSALLTNTASTTLTLPPGLTFKSSWVNGASTIGGVIYGTPTTAGSYPTTVWVVSPGNAQLSQSITITITGSSVPTAPAITGQPAATNVIAGKSASFTVTASGTAPLNYYWLKNGTALADGGNISGSATATLTLTNVGGADAANYSVLVSNSVSTAASSNAALTVVLPPGINSQPAPQTQAVGGNATFSVTASGSAPLNYFWLKNGAAIANGAKYSGVNSSNLTVAALATTDAGNFSVTVSNLAGSVTSSNAALTVVSAPTITAPPANVSVVAGAGASFTVTATGSAPLTYQWLKNGTPLANGGNVSGSTNATLNFSAVTTNDAASYSVAVSNSLGGIISSPATLTVSVPPAIVMPPASATVLAGSNVSFTVTASGTATLFYQWLKNGTTISGATNAILTLASISANDAASYSVIVSNLAGTATSSAAVLTVSTVPSITTPPVNVYGIPGSNISFSVTADGSAPLTYQWLKNGTPLSNAGNITGATNATLNLSAITTNDAASYTVAVSNSFGGVISSAATLTVAVPPAILSSPANVTTQAGSNVSFTVTASGTATLFYQWLKNGTAISGANSATLTLVNVSSADAASYSVTVTNAVGSANSASATLTVLVPPAITLQPVGVSVGQGSPASFTTSATGTAPLSFQWLKNGVKISGANSNVLSFAAVTTNDAASYSVVVTNIVGTIASSSATLTVLVSPVILTQPVSATVAAGSNASFTVTAAGTGTLTYQWLKNGTNISGATGATLTLLNVSSADAANYSVVVANGSGSTTSGTAVLNVLAAPSIVTQPVSQSSQLGSNVVLSVTASGSGPLNYQWYKNGSALTSGGNISGSSSNILTIVALTTNEVANYFVIVSNAIGMVTSVTATISVNTAPVITSQPTNQFVAVGATAVLKVAVSGAGPLSYQWYTLSYQWNKKGTKLSDNKNISGATSNTLTLAKAAKSANGNYIVVVKNSYGSAISKPANLSVLTPPSLTMSLIIKPVSHITIPAVTVAAAGASGTFKTVVKGSAPLSYQWFKDGLALADGATVTGSASGVLKIYPLMPDDSGVYTVVVSNPVGSVTNSRTLVVSGGETHNAQTADNHPGIVTLPPVFITQIVRNADGCFTLACSGTPGTNYIMQASADLAAWTDISTNATDAAGQWQVTDTNRANCRFYRLKTAP